MRTIYIDEECKCHVTNDGSMRVVETAFFDGKCNEFIEGYRFIPDRVFCMIDGEEFYGLMIAPWKDYNELALAQSQYELEQLRAADADKQAALELLGVSIDG